MAAARMKRQSAMPPNLSLIGRTFPRHHHRHHGAQGGSLDGLPGILMWDECDGGRSILRISRLLRLEDPQDLGRGMQQPSSRLRNGPADRVQHC